jgi:DNA-binding transcriptional regulator YiaG
MAARRTLTVERLRTAGEAFMQEISRAYYEAGAGLRDGADLPAIHARHALVTSEDALGVAREALSDAPVADEGKPESDERRQARALLDWQVESHVSGELAELDETVLRWESSAVVRVTGEQSLEFQLASIAMANATEREERLAIERARNRLVADELAPMRRERLVREREVTARLGVADSYIATWEALAGFSLAPLAAQAEQFLRDTQPMWDDTVSAVVRKTLGISAREATRADALALLRGRQFDRFFPGAEMESRIRGQVREMGIDPMAAGRVTYDTGERPGKRSRAFCAPVRVPEEVYLVLRPHGGQSDWTTFLHELGHALHFAHMRPDLSFEYRWLGDNSVTEGFAMLFDHLLHDPRWLVRYSDASRGDVPALRRAIAFEELHFLRRYCAKLLYELELHGGEVPMDEAPGRYVERLSGATTFRYDTADAFVDVDPRFYAARYLRAWQLQAVLTDTLVQRYDDDWWRNPRCGPWIMGALWADGQRELGDEMAARVSGAPLGFDPLVRAIERALEA